jgi:2-dehydropantoate 2-reductase
MAMLNICIVGAGAIGGYFGTRLALHTGARVNALARGATLSALRDHGWRLLEDGVVRTAPAGLACDDPRELGVQDLVVLTVKAPALPQLAATLAPLIGSHTTILAAMNGVPWWFSHGLAALGDAPLASIDPDGRIAAALPVSHVVGCVVHMSASTSEPGVSTHRMGRRLIIGEPAGGDSARVQALGETLARAGFEVSCSPRIRYETWYKLWGNMTMNPMSALTGADMGQVLGDPLLRAFSAAAMREAAAVGERIGCAVAQSPDDRQEVTRKLGAFKTSMLQDVEASRPIELDALVGAVREMAARVGVATPMIDALYGLTRVFGRVRGIYAA